jgi:hypothetical protein
MAPRGRAAQSSVPEVANSDNSIDAIDELVVRCLDPKATGADVGRLYKFKDFLGTLGWDTADTLVLKTHLLSCFEARVFYKSAQGINFLAAILNLHPLMLGPIDEVLKRCVVAFPDALLDSCSQVIFKAWLSSSGGMRIAIEQRIFEWMRRALFCSVKTAERCRKLLGTLHSTTRSPEIDELLARYYGPVLMRHTKVANWEVRFNAVALLSAAFPVMPPDQTQIEFEEKITVQFRIMKDAIEDPTESVRRCAVVGTGRILRQFWELLTIEQIAMLLDALAQKATREKSSVKVRQDAIRALGLIAENQLSPAVMTELLSGGLALNMMNDTSPVVRLRFAEFLLKISQKASVFDITRMVDQGSLLSRITADHALANLSVNPYSRRIAEILTRIVAPFDKDNIEELRERCVRLAEAMPQAFLALAYNCTSSTSEINRVRLSVAIAQKAVEYITGGRKINTARILLAAATDLMGSTSLAGVQGTEVKFASSEEKKKLSDFIYKHISDRAADRFLETCDFPEVLEWLSVLDGTRLPSVFLRVSKLVSTRSREDMLRISKSWELKPDPNVEKEWSSLLQSLGKGNVLANTESLTEHVRDCMQLRDLDTLRGFESEMAKTVQGLAKRLPNISKSAENLFRACLEALVQVCASGSDLAAILHPVNVGVISSLTTDPSPADSAPKRARGKQIPVSEPQVRSETEMVQLLSFYVSYLLVCSILADVSLKVLKFDDLVAVLGNWINRSGIDSKEAWNIFLTLVSHCVDAQASASHAFVAVEALAKISQPIEGWEELSALVIDNYGFAPELTTLVTKLSISGDRKAFLDALANSGKSGNISDEVRRLIAPA